MGYSVILTVLSGGDDDEAALLAAAELAGRERAQIQVLPSLPLADAIIWADAFGATYVAGDAVTAMVEAQDRLRRDLEALSQRVADQVGLAFGATGPGIVVIDETSPPWMVLAEHAALADLVVMGARMCRTEGFWSGMPGEALMRVRSPMLVVRAPQTVCGGTVAIAWDGGLPAGRAVRGALPILRAAQKVVILQDADTLNEDEKRAGDPARLSAYLRLNGVERLEQKTVSGRREGPALVSAAEEAGAGLLVAGAFGHSRLGELLTGGATRAFVMAEHGPHLLLAH